MAVKTKVTNYFMVVTCGFSGLPEAIQWDIISRGMAEIRPENPDFIVFDPKQAKTELEDDGRTLHVAYPRLETKVYAKLDDYGSKEVLSENVDRKVNTQYAVTFILAEEY